MRANLLGRHRRGAALGAALVACSALTAVAVGGPGSVAAAAPDLSAVHVKLKTVATGLSQPVALAFRHGDSRVYVVEQGGSIVIVDANGTVDPTPVISGVGVANGEQGLIGATFSPNGTKLYIDHTDGSNNIHIDEYTMNGDVANLATQRSLLTIAHHDSTNHYGGELAFGPDGDLYIAVGDGGTPGDSAGNAQNTDVLLGKILRINPTPGGGLPYTIPANNPFANTAGKRGEIWMYGLRNPWRFSFDASGRMWLADVGQDTYEEVDLAQPGQKGTNWGWNLREGFHPYNGGARPAGAQDPLFEEDHSAGWCAIIGGFQYHGSAIPALDGAYVFGDLCRSNLVGVITKNGVVEQRDLGVNVDTLVNMGQDANGELYAVSQPGTVYKLVSSTPIPPKHGYWEAGTTGQVFGYNGAPTCAAPAATPVVGIAGNAAGYRIVTSTGAIFGCNVATYGSMAGQRLALPMVGMAATKTNTGYWMVASDGGVFSFGDAHFYGSTGGIRLAQPIVGMTATASGKGYWFVASDGGVFAYGDAHFYGSMGGVHLTKPIVGMTATPTGKGYWLVAADGGIFAFGDARFFGSTGAIRLAQPIVGMTATPSGKGYWFVASDGGVFAYGDAPFYGSAVGTGARIVGIAHN